MGDQHDYGEMGPPPRWLDTVLRWAADMRTAAADASIVLLVALGALVLVIGIGSLVRAVVAAG